jgi:hypothetical protein
VLAAVARRLRADRVSMIVTLREGSGQPAVLADTRRNALTLSIAVGGLLT